MINWNFPNLVCSNNKSWKSDAITEWRCIKPFGDPSLCLATCKTYNQKSIKIHFNTFNKINVTSESTRKKLIKIYWAASRRLHEGKRSNQTFCSRLRLAQRQDIRKAALGSMPCDTTWRKRMQRTIHVKKCFVYNRLRIFVLFFFKVFRL